MPSKLKSSAEIRRYHTVGSGMSVCLRLRWLFLASILLGVIGLFAPRYVPALDTVDAAYETTIVIGVVYLLLLIVAVAKHRWRGLLLLTALSIILYWPFGVAALDYACKHNVNVSDHPKTYFFERPPDRATSSAPKAQSSVRLSVRVATAHNLTSTHGRARLNPPPAPDVAQLPDCRQPDRNPQISPASSQNE